MRAYARTTAQEEAIRKGGVVAMLRDPRMRHYSGWRIHGVMGTPLHPSNLTEYVQMYRGCQVCRFLCVCVCPLCECLYMCVFV